MVSHKFLVDRKFVGATKQLRSRHFRGFDRINLGAQQRRAGVLGQRDMNSKSFSAGTHFVTEDIQWEDADIREELKLIVTTNLPVRQSTNIVSIR